MDKLEYGKWCTIAGERYMITDWDTEAQTVTVFHWFSNYTFPIAEVTDISDFKQTDAERRELGYAY